MSFLYCARALFRVKIKQIWNMNLKNLFAVFAFAAVLCACSSPEKVLYFQDLSQNTALQLVEPKPIRLMPEDKVTIIVNSKDPQITALFNLPYTTRTLGGSSSSMANSQGVSGYTLDANGNIDFPILGTIHVAGMTRTEMAAHIKEALIAKNLVKDPVVTVEFMNLTYQVLGEVKTPGRYSIDKDRTTLLDALSRAGDLTIYGKRDKVVVQREEGNEMKAYVVNLNSAQEVFNSPVYYLRQNDIVYVEPNDVRARQSTVNGNNVRSTSFWMSLASLLTSVTSTIVVLTK